MAMTLTWRPSTLAAACAPTVLANAAQAHVLAHPAVSIKVRTAPTLGLLPATAGTLKINNYIGAAAAAPAIRTAGEGATTSLIQTVSAAEFKNAQFKNAQDKNVRNEKVQSDMVKGGDARGIPPRGTPV